MQPTTRWFAHIAAWLCWAATPPTLAGIVPNEAVLFLDFAQPHDEVRLNFGARHERSATNGWLEFNTALQFAEVDFQRKLNEVQAASIGGWFFLRRSDEQALLFRGLPETAPGGSMN